MESDNDDILYVKSKVYFYLAITLLFKANFGKKDEKFTSRNNLKKLCFFVSCLIVANLCIYVTFNMALSVLLNI